MLTLSLSLFLSPSPLSLLKVTSQHITIILLCTFQPAHPPETSLTALGEITSHPQGVCRQDSKHKDGSNTRMTSNTSSSPPPQISASSPSANIQLLLLLLLSHFSRARLCATP